MQQYVERFRYSRSRHWIAFYNRLVCAGTSHNVIRFYGQNFLKNVSGTECFKCPNLHFSETLTPELCFTTKRLLSNKRVWSDRTRVHFIFNHVTQFQHIYYTYCSSLVEAFTCSTIV